MYIYLHIYVHLYMYIYKHLYEYISRLLVSSSKVHAQVQVKFI